ncbi:MAG: extracellular solute-binding protein, partial [Lachnospiraceae bacterium]|nr:extracellular solute-binding protein [Lachnospiraceae bacterium]
MKKKVISVLLTAAMLTGLLAGCGSNGDTTTSTDNTTQTMPEQTESTPADTTQTEPAADTGSDAGEAVNLKWAIWDKDSTPYWNALKDAYEAANPNVTLEMVDLGAADYMTVLATELSGSGSDFDVVTIKDVPGYATLVSKNTLEPLDSYISAAGIDLSQYGGVDKQITVNGSLYELPFRNDFWVVFYNKDIFDAAGVDYPTNDMTFDEYDALARKVADPTFGSQIYGTHYHTWRSAVQLFGVLDGKHSILDGNYDSFKPYY